MRYRTVLGMILIVSAALAAATIARTDPGRAAGAAPRTSLGESIDRIVAETSWTEESEAAAAEVIVGVHVVDLATRETVYEREADESLNPASNAKLFVAAAALRRLGVAFTAATTLFGVVERSSIRGDVVLRGHGDPTLEAEDLWSMARHVRARGISRVTGGVVVDDSYFDDRRLPCEFDSQPNEDSAFRSAVGAASVDANAIDVVIGPGRGEGDPAAVWAYPSGFLRFDNDAVTTEGGRNALRLFVREVDGTEIARVRGRIGIDADFDGYCRRVEDPVAFAGAVMRDALKSAGVGVESDEVARGSAPDDAIEIARHESDPMGTWLWRLGKDSSNFHAEQLLRILGAETEGPPGTAEAGAEAVRETLAEMGVDTAGLVLRNGSGLYDADRATPRMVTALLAAVYRDARIRPEFLAHLSIAGVDGTAGSRLRSSDARGLIRVKTGTLAAVSALSGYVLAADGRSGYAFSIIVNGASGRVSIARNLQDSVVRTLDRSLDDGDPPPTP